MKETEQAVLEIKRQDARHRFLEKLFFMDGRDNPEHPYHATYTGLYMQYVEKLEKD
jgi:hypothetical protein